MRLNTDFVIMTYLKKFLIAKFTLNSFDGRMLSGSTRFTFFSFEMTAKFTKPQRFITYMFGPSTKACILLTVSCIGST